MEPGDRCRRLHGHWGWASLRLTRQQRDGNGWARRLDPKATCDDIVLPDEQMALLHQVADQVGQRGWVYDEWGFRGKTNRGLGISALFAGDT